MWVLCWSDVVKGERGQLFRPAARRTGQWSPSLYGLSGPFDREPLLLFGQWSWRPGCEVSLTMGTACALARKEASEATVAGTRPAQAVAWTGAVAAGR